MPNWHRKVLKAHSLSLASSGHVNIHMKSAAAYRESRIFREIEYKYPPALASAVRAVARQNAVHLLLSRGFEPISLSRVPARRVCVELLITVFVCVPAALGPFPMRQRVEAQQSESFVGYTARSGLDMT